MGRNGPDQRFSFSTAPAPSMIFSVVSIYWVSIGHPDFKSQDTDDPCGAGRRDLLHTSRMAIQTNHLTCSNLIAGFARRVLDKLKLRFCFGCQSKQSPFYLCVPHTATSISAPKPIRLHREVLTQPPLSQIKGANYNLPCDFPRHSIELPKTPTDPTPQSPTFRQMLQTRTKSHPPSS